MEHKLLAIAYSLVILIIAAGVRVIAGTFLVPAGIFALTWFALTFFPLLLLLHVPINSWAIFYIMVAVFVFAVSSLPFNWRKARRLNLNKSLAAARFDSRFLELALYFSAIMSVVFSVATMIVNGFTIQASLFELLRASGEYAAQRASDEGAEYGLIGLLGVFFTYLCPVLGGLRAQAPRQKWFFFVALTPCLITMVLQSAKLVFLVGLCFYLAAALVAKIYANKMRIRIPRLSRLPKYLFFGSVLATLVLVSFTSRGGIYELEFTAMLEPLAFMLSSYILGQIYAFSEFFSYTVGMPSETLFKDDYYSLGAYSFASIFDMFGIGKEFPPGMYDESSAFIGVFQTNLFTFYRGLIYDFGVMGSLMFLLIFGLFAHSIAYRLFTRRRAWIICVIFIALIVFILMGYLFSVFVARYVFLNAVAVWVLLHLNQMIKHRRSTHALPSLSSSGNS